MTLARFHDLLTNPDDLTALLGPPSELVLKKQLAALDEPMRAFVARSPLLLLGTVGPDGSCDVSPRGGGPAAATVLDARTVVLAERPGNRRADSLRNILATGRAGMLFLVPGVGETLRVNGRACVFRDADVLAPLAVNGKAPVLGIGVEVEECYFQCAKALIRSRLWAHVPADPGGPGFDYARVLVDQTRLAGQTVESLRQQIETSYRERLY